MVAHLDEKWYFHILHLDAKWLFHILQMNYHSFAIFLGLFIEWKVWELVLLRIAFILWAFHNLFSGLFKNCLYLNDPGVGVGFVKKSSVILHEVGFVKKYTPVCTFPNRRFTQLLFPQLLAQQTTGIR